jgi:putative flippase GtrA
LKKLTNIAKKSKMLLKYTKAEFITQFIRYFITGALATVSEYIVFTTIYTGFRALYAANTIGMSVGFIISFVMNRSWSFKSKGNPVRQLVLTLILFIINLGISNVFIHILSNMVGIHPQLSKLMVMGVIVMWNFVLYRKVIYK